MVSKDIAMIDYRVGYQVLEKENDRPPRGLKYAERIFTAPPVSMPPTTALGGPWLGRRVDRENSGTRTFEWSGPALATAAWTGEIGITRVLQAWPGREIGGMVIWRKNLHHDRQIGWHDSSEKDVGSPM